MLSNKAATHLSSLMICGENSPKSRKYKVFSLDIFKTEKDLGVKFSRSHGMERRSLDIELGVTLGSIVKLSDRTGAFAPMVSLSIPEKKVLLYDVVFTNDEYDTFGKDIDVLIDRKVEALSLLIECLHKKKVSILPLIVNDFPNISRLLLSSPDRFSF